MSTTRVSRMRLGLLGSELQAMLAFYLKTGQEVDPDDPSPIFWQPRSARVDQLLCRLLLDAAYVVDELYLALKEVQEGLVYSEPGDLVQGWARAAAREVHPYVELYQRTQVYLDALVRRWNLGAVRQAAAPPPVSATDETVQLPDPLGQMQGQLEQLRQQVDTLQSGGVHNRRYFERRLAEEVSRASRGNDRFSVVYLDLLEIEEIFRTHGSEVAAEVVRESGARITGCLREYDICSRNETAEFMILLPGATEEDCASVIARLRNKVTAAARSGPGIEICVGTASWPRDGSTVADLVEQVEASLQRDKQRVLRGEVELGSIPPSMVERQARGEEQPHTVWFEGFPQEVRVSAVPTSRGLRLKMPLRFLKRGAAVQLTPPEGRPSEGTLQDTVLGRGSPSDAFPMLYMNVSTRGRAGLD